MQDMGPNNWFYINVMLDNSELFVPLPDQLDGEVEHALNSKLRGVALRWEQLRVGYFFGGDGEKILRVNAHELSMIGRLPEVVHSQVGLKPADSVLHLQLSCSKECRLAFWYRKAGRTMQHGWPPLYVTVAKTDITTLGWSSLQQLHCNLPSVCSLQS